MLIASLKFLLNQFSSCYVILNTGGTRQSADDFARITNVRVHYCWKITLVGLYRDDSIVVCCMSATGNTAMYVAF